MSNFFDQYNTQLPPTIAKRIARSWERNEQRIKPQQPLGNGANYWNGYFPYALAVIQIVLLHGKADKQYLEAKNALSLPGCQEITQDFTLFWQDTDSVKARLIRMLVCLKDHSLIWPALPFDTEKYSESPDFAYFVDRVYEVIKVGFNRDIDQANHAWQVLPSLEHPWLFTALVIWLVADHEGIDLSTWNQYRPFIYKGKVIDTQDIMANKPTNRIHRRLVAFGKQYGHLLHDETLRNDAEHWYGSRVDPGTIEKYITDLVDNGITSPDHPADSGRISNNIRPFDDATGHPR